MKEQSHHVGWFVEQHGKFVGRIVADNGYGMVTIHQEAVGPWFTRPMILDDTCRIYKPFMLSDKQTGKIAVSQ